MRRIVVKVRGAKPKPWGSKEQQWRAKIASAAVQANSKISREHHAEKYNISIVFYMTSTHIKHADLDNLAKPVMDTLFHARYPQVKNPNLTGSLLKVDDDRVFRLKLEKKCVSAKSEEGCDILVTW